MVRYLLNSGADADLAMADGATPLTVAVQAGHVDIVTALVAPSGAKKGANVNQPEDDGWTPLMLVSHFAVVRACACVRVLCVRGGWWGSSRLATVVPAIIQQHLMIWIWGASFVLHLSKHTRLALEGFLLERLQPNFSLRTVQTATPLPKTEPAYQQRWYE